MMSHDQEVLSSPPHRSHCTSHVISRFVLAFFCAILGDSQPTPAVIPSSAEKCDEGAAQSEQDNLREQQPDGVPRLPASNRTELRQCISSQLTPDIWEWTPLKLLRNNAPVHTLTLRGLHASLSALSGAWWREEVLGAAVTAAVKAAKPQALAWATSLSRRMPVSDMELWARDPYRLNSGVWFQRLPWNPAFLSCSSPSLLQCGIARALGIPIPVVQLWDLCNC